MPGVVYQIFVDRFAAGRVPPDEPERAREEGTVRRAWRELPEEPGRGRDLFGGDLDGVWQKLDHVAALGADAIYLTPIFRAPSNHKYDAASFDEIDEHFGGAGAFERLAKAARARGLGLILDGVFNHVGERHPWAREKKFLRGSVWRGFSSLPELALQNPALRNALFGEDGVIARWTHRGATGWRLDCANDLGPEICALATAAARAAGATDGVIGEYMAYPAPAGFDGVDGAMNYWLRSCALALASGTAPAAQIQNALDRLAAEANFAALQKSWNLVGSHDTPRLSNETGSEPQARLALALAFAYPGVPMIYYGDEIGMRGGPDPQNRAPMIWDESRWDRARLDWVRRLCSLRRERPALQHGRYVPMPQPGTDAIAFARATERPSELLLFVANASARPLRAKLFLPHAALLDALPLADLFCNAAKTAPRAGTLEVELPPHGCALYAPVDDDASGYKFFK